MLKIRVGFLVLVFSATLFAQEAKAPTLSDTQKLQIQNTAQRIQIAQLQIQAAQRDFETARTELQTLLKSLEKDGWTLDLQTFTYLKKDAPKKH
jgi:hypothetical protein